MVTDLCALMCRFLSIVLLVLNEILTLVLLNIFVILFVSLPV
jgi:hypothetical protein